MPVQSQISQNIAIASSKRQRKEDTSSKYLFALFYTVQQLILNYTQFEKFLIISVTVLIQYVVSLATNYNNRSKQFNSNNLIQEMY